MAAEDRRWLDGALAAWTTVLRDYLNADQPPLPPIVVYDGRCSYMLASSAPASAEWTAAEHRGEIALPNGARIPPAPNAFNAAGEGGNFVVMSLPSIWRPVAPPSEIPLEWFLEGVLLHELAHAYQAAVTPSVSFPALLAVRSSVSDDSIQDAFRGDPDYVRDYEAERDLLYRAAAASSQADAAALVCEALEKLTSRRERRLGAPDMHWAAVDELSLTTEGLGQWVSYAWLTRGRGLAAELVLSKLRSPYWSQDEGLAIFLAVDRLVPDWQRLMFSSPPATAGHLLRRACGR